MWVSYCIMSNYFWDCFVFKFYKSCLTKNKSLNWSSLWKSLSSTRPMCDSSTFNVLDTKNNSCCNNSILKQLYLLSYYFTGFRVIKCNANRINKTIWWFKSAKERVFQRDSNYSNIVLHYVLYWLYWKSSFSI